ncbi:Arc15 [Kluyveromyces lactis]|uniref:Actin-related protein 2/3 complex subunit 5 n=1 Tax=Kluyveromyces lactis (strain ATCC 8585 / CBS 2359 / DSM 70799 / NBRC 1267 / NRRL Y-1140 / WM37) TaxID=284590 RepID=Q6CU34_KLULA|nr:uncharacterized protein KLLA0_C07975g [Kluyveromyces lactis]QEU59988.1 Arc15 [Kluyveromyces lactis]CAH01406.1 KLLA0C07975p [Kluyveromyces lactis]|eukprot:XP_452555.1 uncharacterized protein KLLA0_C07975g [Kluyveromyces lactis]
MEDWRRIDIDAYDPESGRLTADDLKPPYSHTVSLQELQPTIQQLRSYTSSGDFAAAVELFTTDPPYNADEQAKSQYFSGILEVLTQVRQVDIANIVKRLDRKQQDALIKYLYKGMSIPEGQKHGGILLAWFEKLTQVAGVNPIVHYLSDRRTV